MDVLNYSYGFYLIFALGALKVLSVVLASVQRLLRGGKDVRKYGTWAVVTGATDGIGLAYAKELYKKGMSVMLISRTESKLKACVEEIGGLVTKGGDAPEVRYIVADYQTGGKPMYAEIAEELEGLDVGILINNVGRSYPSTQYLWEVDESVLEGMVELNVRATIEMTRIVLGNESSGMVGRKRGLVVNITSAAGVIQTGDPMYSVYSGTKGMVNMFSRSMSLELATKNVQVECHVPYFVTTKLAKLRRSSLLIPTPETWARASVSQFGSGLLTIVPYIPHAIQHFVIESLPYSVAAAIITSMHAGIRKKYLKKLARQEAEKKKE